MKTIVMMFALLCVSGVAAEVGKTLAQEAAGKKESPVHLVVSASVSSKYLNKFGIVAYDRTVTPVDVTVSVRAPLGTVYAKLWASSDIDADFGKTRSEGGDELEVWIGWKYMYRDWFSFDQSIAYFNLSPTEEERGDIFISHSKVEILKVKNFLVPYFEYRQVRSMEDGNKKRGGYAWFGAYRSQKIGTLKAGQANFIADLSGGYSLGALNRDPGPVYWQLKLSAQVPIGKGVSIIPSLSHQELFKNQEGTPQNYGDWRKPQTVFGLSLQYKW